ncbi:RNA helicase [Saxophila tyrrhenica]|uniref:RNA helicase n=1 Tax=Saxophila tyrrhenica TaxID=1690608 RepID=A0AAV9NZQ8_9PEZI|nr:RNA helicase [Saxophila tyrrhenica]
MVYESLHVIEKVWKWDVLLLLVRHSSAPRDIALHPSLMDRESRNNPASSSALQSPPPSTTRCIYCAFRSHQHALRARRLNLPPPGSLRLHSQSQRAASTGTLRSKHRRTEGREHGNGSTRRSPSGSKDSARSVKITKHILDYEPSDAGTFRPLTKNGGHKVTGRNARNAAQQQYSFDQALSNRLQVAKEELKDVPLLTQLRKEAGARGDKAEPFEKVWKRFVAPLRGEATPFIGFDEKRSGVLKGLQEAYSTRGQNGLDDRIRYAFYAELTGARFTATDIRNQQALADLRYPSEWYPATRVMHRTIHLHVGPTNSGKTYHALQRLEQAETGMYAGPLRLLAHEVYSRMNAKGKSCSLITGEERRIATHQGTDNNIAACTVEMATLNRTMDVAVIDEIQMIGSADRGWAWTAALMGVKAKEVHLCGEVRTIPLIREICASLGEKLEIHHYERLSPLKVADTSLKGRLADLKKGDCIVSFSVMGIHALRKQIEKITGKKVATVYGSLPPETRAQQARLFNDPDNDYDYLVASDAVGMGLNLAIKRIIFEEASKFDGTRRGPLSVADIKQIAGRAGRYRIADQQMKEADKRAEQQDLAAAKGEPTPPSPSTLPPTQITPDDASNGLVTTLEDFDFPLVRAAMSAEPDPIRTAGLFPPAAVLERFSSYFPPSTPFSYILTRLHELSQMHSRFHLCGLKDQVWLADVIEPVQGLTVVDRTILTNSPASKTDFELWSKLMPALARCVAEQKGGDLVDIAELPLEILDAEVSASREYLRALERLHKGIVSYLWLSYRFAGIFSSRGLAFHTKGLVEEKIEEVLGKFSFTEATRRKLAAKREMEVLREMEKVGVDEGGIEEEGEARVDEEVVKREGFALGRERGRDGGEGGEGTEREGVERQTEFAFGGNRFGGEEEMAFDDPLQAEVVDAEEGEAGVGETEGKGSFAKWRRQETKVDSTTGAESDVDTPLADSAPEGEDAAREAAANDRIFDVSRDDLPAVSDVLRDEAGAEQTFIPAEASEAESAMSPEQDPSNISAPTTPETDLDSAATGSESETSAPPLETQEVSPSPPPDELHGVVNQAPREERPAPASGMPPKHLHAHLEAEVKEGGRGVESRP